ncbi:hypothetical protein NXW85_09135 [Bacteroides caccae]|nr:hypothetical protein NXW85_09135 [Bacteroides caccae]
METNTDKRKTLIRRLLVEQLLPEEKQNLLKRNSVENEMKKQWKQFEDDPIKSEEKKGYGGMSSVDVKANPIL